MTREAEEAYRSRVRGCLLGGAIGDALGAPVEFSSLEEILSAHPDGVRTFVAGQWPAGTVTDDTQMTLFTVEGLIRAGIRRDRGLGLTIGVVHSAYDRWLDTQNLPAPKDHGWLIGQQWLYARRAPGTTCLTALTEARQGGDSIPQYGGQARNESKGCGGVMRVAPIGLLPPFDPGDTRPWVFRAACDAAGYTHGHPTGKLAAGAFALIIHALTDGLDLDAAVDVTLDELRKHPGFEETERAIVAARELAAAGSPSYQLVKRLGEGWVAEEALAIALYAALACPEEFVDALALAVTHSGDSDSTGSICGNLLGAWHGETALPPELVFRVEGRATILVLADDFVYEFTRSNRLHGEYGPFTGWSARY